MEKPSASGLGIRELQLEPGRDISPPADRWESCRPLWREDVNLIQLAAGQNGRAATIDGRTVRLGSSLEVGRIVQQHGQLDADAAMLREVRLRRIGPIECRPSVIGGK